MDDQPLPLFSNFVKHYATPEYKRDMDLIRKWMSELGEKYGASTDYFRNEGMAHAIPPPGGITKSACRLRLYCLRVSHRVVILFDGGYKTAQKAQDCPNVAPHFHLANQLVDAFWRACHNDEIEFDHNDDLVWKPGLKITL